jgi:hypothetical protein
MLNAFCGNSRHKRSILEGQGTRLYGVNGKNDRRISTTHLRDRYKFEHQRGVLYLRCFKALYGHIEAARLFYDDSDHTIQKVLMFKQNQYDPCVHNKGEKQDMTTIRTHVDDLKISSRSKEKIKEVINKLRTVYGEITVHYGNEHDYLGMMLIYQPEEKPIILSMKKYVEGILDQFEIDNSDEKIKTVKTPASDHLFNVRKHGEEVKLAQHRSTQFHATVAKLLFLAKRGRPDILLAISFLTTRVKAPDTDDWKNCLEF